MQNTNNVISIQIPQEELDSAMAKLQEVFNQLSPYLVALTTEERKTLPKMSDKTIPFVEKTMGYMNSDPTLSPTYVDVEEMQIDFQAARELTQVLREAQRICSGLNDTIMLTGSEAYVAALAYYHAIKGASRINVPGAKPIYEDLRKRFATTSRRPDSTEAVSTSKKK